MQDALAVIAVLALFGGVGSAILAGLLGRIRLAVKLGLVGVVGGVIAFVFIVLLTVPAAERLRFIGAITCGAGLLTMSLPSFVTLRCKTEPRWVDPLTKTGILVGSVGVVVMLVAYMWPPP
jgi:hypothetical protein